MYIDSYNICGFKHPLGRGGVLEWTPAEKKDDYCRDVTSLVLTMVPWLHKMVRFEESE